MFGYDRLDTFFYPVGMKEPNYLAHYSLIFHSMEIEPTL
jgi:hypothetical protein